MAEKVIKKIVWRDRYMRVDETFLEAFAASVWVNDVFLGTSFGK